MVSWRTIGRTTLVISGEPDGRLRELVVATSIFSSYRQGENRVTSTMLAVFERIGIGLVERIIAAAVGEASLEMVTYANQPSSGGRGTPTLRFRQTSGT